MIIRKWITKNDYSTYFVFKSGCPFQTQAQRLNSPYRLPQISC